MMGAVAEPSPPLSTTAAAVPDVEYIVPPPGADIDLLSPSSPRTFKTHRTLPHSRHPSGSVYRNSGSPDSRRSSSGSQRYTNPLLFERTLPANGSRSHVASIHTLRHQRRRISGGDLPPTPPAHSRTSSSSKSISLSNISPLQTPAQSSEDVLAQTSPSTPLLQRSPPTPEVTPPRPQPRFLLAPERPTLPSRIPSKSTTTDSRTESFRTALESPDPSEDDDDDDSDPTLRATPSARTSEVTVRRLNGDETKFLNEAGLGSRAGSRRFPDEAHDLTPKASKGAFNSFDGEWGDDGLVEQEWDNNLARTVTVKKRSHRSPHAHEEEPYEIADDRTVSPTNATRAVRGLPLQGRILTYDSPDTVRSCTAPEPATTKATATSPAESDSRRVSGMSTRSTASTTVEAVLVNPPFVRRNKTLRHVKRVDGLRDAIWQSPPRSCAPSVESARPSPRAALPRESIRESFASTSTTNSATSRRARKDIWKSGAIPVVVVPDRHSSTRSSSQDRSIPSTRSQRSRGSQSFTPVPPLSQVPKTHDLTPYFDRPSRRTRRTSESDGSTPGEQRTMDFPPTVPRRTSSLSAPTSRNGSRRASITGSHTGSLTAESLKAHNDSVVAHGTPPRMTSRAIAGAVDSPTATYVPTVPIDSVPSYHQLQPNEQSEAGDRKQRIFDSLLGSPLLPTQTTPFSQMSVETSGTAAEISQAMAMSIDRHQNRSVLMVDHRPSESSDGERRPERPIITTTDANGLIVASREITAQDEPITPPQAQPPLFLNEVDSPLRNPRVPPEPPEPPVLRFIAATPSGLTPADERPRLLGNFYDEVEAEEKPSRGLSIVRRALSKRRNSYGPSPSHKRPGFLTRTLSLNRNMRGETAGNTDVDEFGPGSCEEPPYDESHLHPDWQPSYFPESYGDEGDGVIDVEDAGPRQELGYPMIDNRPRPPKRTLSERMKHTFAIMPIRNYRDEYMYDDEPERRTIRRDPSGSLRVVKKRGSVGSLRDKQRHQLAEPPRPPPPEARQQRTPVFPRRFGSLAKLKRRGSEDSVRSNESSSNTGLRRTWSLTQGMQGLSRRVSERRREKRSAELRRKISAPRDCRDGVEDVIRRDGMREAYGVSRRQVGRV
ncbi:unnamed protein product [Discula destructiva]